MQLTRIPSLTWSTAIARVMPITACFDVVYANRSRMPRSPAVDAVFTITPFFFGRKHRVTASFERRKVPLTLTRRIASNCSSLVVTTVPEAPIPALLTRTSRSPSFFTVSEMIRSQSAGLEMSPATEIAFPEDLALIRLTVGVAASSETSLTATFAPSRAKARAVACPMPLPAPVTRTTLFLKRMGHDHPRPTRDRQGIKPKRDEEEIATYNPHDVDRLPRPSRPATIRVRNHPLVPGDRLGNFHRVGGGQDRVDVSSIDAGRLGASGRKPPPRRQQRKGFSGRRGRRDRPRWKDALRVQRDPKRSRHGPAARERGHPAHRIGRKAAAPRDRSRGKDARRDSASVPDEERPQANEGGAGGRHTGQNG